jgi:hypothetical protein
MLTAHGPVSLVMMEQRIRIVHFFFMVEDILTRTAKEDKVLYVKDMQMV